MGDFDVGKHILVRGSAQLRAGGQEARDDHTIRHAPQRPIVNDEELSVIP